ncbi:MAG: squalene/phytoene synthase family protein [Pseudomonadota bacterium]
MATGDRSEEWPAPGNDRPEQPGLRPADLPHEIRALSPLFGVEETDPEAAVAAITAASGTSFGPGMRALSAPRRRAMWALYAFARVIDDVADEPMEDTTREALLTAWRTEIEALYAGAPVSVIGRALEPGVSAYELPKEEFLGLIDGMAMDAAGPIVSPKMDVLRRYTRLVAGTVGLLSMRIFGAWRGAVSARFALALADALQLTNITRDVAEDAARGRLYLPAELLSRHGVTQDPDAAASDPAIAGVLREMATLARQEFDTARETLPAHARLAVLPALMMMGVYEATLNRIEDSGFRTAPRVRLGKGAKIVAALSTAISPSAHRRSVV